MKPEEINKAIAESVGIEIYEEPDGSNLWSAKGSPHCHKRCGLSREHAIAVCLPDYHDSLDAIVPVVRALQKDEMTRVIVALCKVTIYGKAFSAYIATPAEWCEAYLKSKGLWHE